jgi:hypothetical protein
MMTIEGDIVHPLPPEDDSGEPVSRPPLRMGRPLSQHVLGAEVMIAAVVSPSGFEQKEKTCKNCGAVRVTMIGSVWPRAWRRTPDGPQVLTMLAPPCNSEAAWP